jgi:hypothetical protein
VKLALTLSIRLASGRFVLGRNGFGMRLKGPQAKSPGRSAAPPRVSVPIRIPQPQPGGETCNLDEINRLTIS